MKRILLMLMFFVMVGCSGPSKQEACIPEKGQQNNQAMDDSQVADLSQIDKKLEEAKIITTIVDRIKREVVGDSFSFTGAQKLFTGFVSSPMVYNGVLGAFVLYVMIYGIMLIGGMVQAKLGDVVIRMVKVSFIAIFAMNWADFYDFIGQASLNFTDEMLGYFLNVFQAKFKIGNVQISIQESVFTKLDYFVARMFSQKMIAMLSALFLAGGSSGPIYAVVLVMAILYIFRAIMLVVLVYCFSLFARAMLFAVAPIFIAFMLFKPTQQLFDSWWKQIVSYSLQPVMVGAFLGFFLAVMQPFFQDFLKYQFCWQAIDTTKETYGWVFINPETGNKVDFGANSEPPMEIQRILLFLGFGYIFYSATSLGQKMAAGLAGTIAGNLSGAAKGLGGLANFTGKNSALSSLIKQI